MYVAAKRQIPTLIQEQNSFPGITNRRLARKAHAICVAYQDMDRYFPKEKIYFTGNPVRNLKDTNATKKQAIDFFGLNDSKKTLLITGGSLGAKSINNTLLKNYNILKNADFQVIWQTGERYFDAIKQYISQKSSSKNIHITKFINRMDLAYKPLFSIARAGAYYDDL